MIYAKFYYAEVSCSALLFSYILDTIHYITIHYTEINVQIKNIANKIPRSLVF